MWLIVGSWNATLEVLDLEVSPGQSVPSDASTVVRLGADVAAFRWARGGEAGMLRLV